MAALPAKNLSWGPCHLKKVRQNLVKDERDIWLEPIPRLDIRFSSQYRNLVLVSDYLGVNINCPFIRKSKVAPRKVRQNLVKDERERWSTKFLLKPPVFLSDSSKPWHIAEQERHTLVIISSLSLSKSWKRFSKVFKTLQYTLAAFCSLFVGEKAWF